MTNRLKIPLVNQVNAIQNVPTQGPTFGGSIRIGDKCDTTRNSNATPYTNYVHALYPANQNSCTLFSGSPDTAYLVK